MNVVYAQSGQPLPLGRRWEHQATRIVFDISAWVDAFGAGNVRLLHQRTGDAAPYPVGVRRTDADAETVNNETGVLVLWDVTRTDTAKPLQFGKAELRYYAGNEGAERFLVKSELYKTSVLNAMGATLAEAPASERSWLDELLSAAKGIEANAEAAHNDAVAAQAAKDAVENLSVSVSSASPDSQATVTKAVDADTGVVSLTFSIPRGATGQRGVAFTPSVDKNGVLSWTNDGELPNPPNVTLGMGAGAAIPFFNDSDLLITPTGDGGEIVAAYDAEAGAKVEVQAEIPVTVTTATSGGDAQGWRPTEALVAMECQAGDDTQDRYPSWTLGDGEHVLRTQYVIAAKETGRNVVKIRLLVEKGELRVMEGDAVLLLSGVRESD